MFSFSSPFQSAQTSMRMIASTNLAKIILSWAAAIWSNNMDYILKWQIKSRCGFPLLQLRMVANFPCALFPCDSWQNLEFRSSLLCIFSSKPSLPARRLLAVVTRRSPSLVECYHTTRTSPYWHCRTMTVSAIQVRDEAVRFHLFVSNSLISLPQRVHSL
ncbi:MAG: hypothetical protein Ct9H90mP14_3710 [Methanobacteriota archaeon]|nr:MAG: hypothetical protein Ct9H90mP14_3710 [Euryarchaeota archaeon]